MEKKTKIKWETIKSAFDTISDGQKITLLKWIKSIEKSIPSIEGLAKQVDLDAEINERELADSELQHDIDNHTTDTSIHVTLAEKDTWTNHTNNNDIHVTLNDKERWDSGRNPLYKHEVSITDYLNNVYKIILINSNSTPLTFVTVGNYSNNTIIINSYNTELVFYKSFTKESGSGDLIFTKFNGDETRVTSTTTTDTITEL